MTTSSADGATVQPPDRAVSSSVSRPAAAAPVCEWVRILPSGDPPEPKGAPSRRGSNSLPPAGRCAAAPPAPRPPLRPPGRQRRANPRRSGQRRREERIERAPIAGMPSAESSACSAARPPQNPPPVGPRLRRRPPVRLPSATVGGPLVVSPQLFPSFPARIGAKNRSGRDIRRSARGASRLIVRQTRRIYRITNNINAVRSLVITASLPGSASSIAGVVRSSRRRRGQGGRSA